MVRKIATGSFAPDSISSVLLVRRSRCRPPARSRNSTAAASVEASTAPSSSDCSGASCRNQCAARLVSAAVTATPTVASTSEGATLPRTCAARVCSPPSNRITHSASEPTK